MALPKSTVPTMMCQSPEVGVETLKDGEIFPAGFAIQSSTALLQSFKRIANNTDTMTVSPFVILSSNYKKRRAGLLVF